MTFEQAILSFIAWSARIGQAVVEWYVAHTRDIINVFHVGFDTIFTVLLYIAAVASAAYLVITIASLFTKPRKLAKPIGDKGAPTVAIHIPTRNELCAIACAEACLANNYPQDKIHIYIGDDSNQADVSKQLKAFADSHKTVSYHKRKENIGFKPGNLNNMLKHTNEELLIIFDSDFLPEKHFIRTMISELVANPELEGVQARWKPINWRQTWTSSLASALNEVFHQLALPVMQRTAGSGVLCGSGEAVRVKTLKSMGGWTAGAFTEDIDYSCRLIKSGKKIAYLDTLTVPLEVPYKPMDFFKQQMRWAFGVITALRTHFPGLRIQKKPNAPLVSGFLALGYLLSNLLLLLITFGTLSFITHPPGPLNIPLFVQQTTFNIFITSGLIIGFVVALLRARRPQIIVKGLLSGFSIGIVATAYIFKGIFRSFTGQDMQWYLLNKKGHERIKAGENSASGSA